MIYLDNAATTKILPEVLEDMLPFLGERYGNAGSLHAAGRDAAKAVGKAREQVAGLIGAAPEQIVFTSGGSEANNLAIRGGCFSSPGVLISPLEHDSVWNAAHSIKTCGVLRVMPRYGTIIFDELRETLQSGDYGLVSIMRVNNETGGEHAPRFLRYVAEECHYRGALFHTDCVQAAGNCDIDVRELDCDFLSISSHKIHGPKGVGALYVKNKKTLRPLIYGGDYQEFGLRGGTENVAGIVGFGSACEYTKRHLSEIWAAVAACKDAFLDAFRGAVKLDGWRINGEEGQFTGVGKILNFYLPGIDAETLVLMADSKGLCISAGSACHSRQTRPSRVLTAIGLSEEEAMQSVRVSFSHLNTPEEAAEGAKILAECIEKIRAAC